MDRGAGRQLRAARACLGQVLCEVLAHEVEERGLLAGRCPQGRPLPQRLPAASPPPPSPHSSRTATLLAPSHAVMFADILMALMSAHMGVLARRIIQGEGC